MPAMAPFQVLLVLSLATLASAQLIMPDTTVLGTVSTAINAGTIQGTSSEGYLGDFVAVRHWPLQPKCSPRPSQLLNSFPLPTPLSSLACNARIGARPLGAPPSVDLPCSPHLGIQCRTALHHRSLCSPSH